MRPPAAIIWDLDLTLVDSSCALELRRARAWPHVYQMIPEFCLYQGVHDMLAAVQAATIPCALVTSAPRPYAERVVEHFGFGMDFLVCYHDTRRHKPHPEPIALAIDKLDVPPGQVWSVGDEAKDILASREAGANTIGALWGSLDKRSVQAVVPDAVVHSPDEIVQLIRLSAE